MVRSQLVLFFLAFVGDSPFQKVISEVQMLAINWVDLHGFFVQFAHYCVNLFYQFAVWVLMLFQYSGNGAAAKAMTFLMVLFFLSVLFGVYWWPTRFAPALLKILLWIVILPMIIYTLMLFLPATLDVLQAAPINEPTSTAKMTK